AEVQVVLGRTLYDRSDRSYACDSQGANERRGRIAANTRRTIELVNPKSAFSLREKMHLRHDYKEKPLCTYCFFAATVKNSRAHSTRACSRMPACLSVATVSRSRSTRSSARRSIVAFSSMLAAT